MWSDKYFYLNIISDFGLSEGFSTQALVDFLKLQPELTQVADFTFSNNNQFPIFTNVLLLKAKNYDSWSDKDVDYNFTNMLAIVCAKSDAQTFELVRTFLIKIASFLNWRLIDEETDDGVENCVLWKPAE